MKHIITTAKNAVKKGLVKKGDKVWVKVEVGDIDNKGISDNNNNFYFDIEKIRIPKPEPKPIDFAVAGRVLRVIETNAIFITTGQSGKNYFYCYNPKNGWAGNLSMENPSDYEDITEEYSQSK